MKRGSSSGKFKYPTLSTVLDVSALLPSASEKTNEPFDSRFNKSVFIKVNYGGRLTVIKAVIFDMDGVLFDTERLELECSNEVLHKYGQYMPQELYAETCSMVDSEYKIRLETVFGAEFDFDSFEQETSALIRSRLKEDGIPVKDGVREILIYLETNRYRTAVATSTSKSKAERYLKEAEIYKYFDAVVCGDMVARSKPYPDVYEAAAGALGLSTGKCIAVEDSSNGIKSAVSAGCITVMVPDLLAPDAYLSSVCSCVAKSLIELVEIIDIYRHVQKTILSRRLRIL